jgi:hypothetical protein
MALLIVAPGCDSGVTGDSSFLGTYSLKTVNGNSLPASASGIEYLDGTISLAEAGTYSETAHIRTIGSGQTTTISEVGAYTSFGTSITLRSADGSHTRITLIDNNNTLTHTEAGVTLVYRK